MQPFYKLIFVDSRYRGYKKLASLLFLINSIIFFSQALQSSSISNRIILYASSFLLLIYSIYSWSYKQKKEKPFIIFYVLIAVIWIIETPFWYFGLAFLIMTYLQLKLEKDFSISFFAQKVVINSFLKQSYNWSEFTNIVLKDDLLTVDFADNKIFQAHPNWVETIQGNRESWHEIEDYDKMEKEFNDFCKQHLNK